MKQFLSFALLSAIAMDSCSGAALNSTLPDSMFLVGTANGKDLYGDRMMLNWHQAKGYCNYYGMTPVSVNTEAKLALLRKLNVDNYWKVWTSGRDAQRLRMNSWDDTNEMPALKGVGFYYGQYQVCLVGDSVTNGFEFALDLCSKEYQILCEMNTKQS